MWNVSANALLKQTPFYIVNFLSFFLRSAPPLFLLLVLIFFLIRRQHASIGDFLYAYIMCWKRRISSFFPTRIQFNIWYVNKGRGSEWRVLFLNSFLPKVSFIFPFLSYYPFLLGMTFLVSVFKSLIAALWYVKYDHMIMKI